MQTPVTPSVHPRLGQGAPCAPVTLLHGNTHVRKRLTEHGVSATFCIDPQALRELSPTVTAWAKEYRVPLSLFSTSNLAFVVWQTLSAARNTLLAQSPGPVFAMMGLALGQHVAYLIFNYLVVW